jgi:hypothetical protein
MLSKHVLMAAAIAGTILVGCKKADEAPPPAAPMQTPTPQLTPQVPPPPLPSGTPPASMTTGTAPATNGDTTKAPGAASSGSASY